MKSAVWVIALTAATLGMASALTATTVRPASVERLSQLATVVIEGHATNSWSEWNAQHTAIYTYTQFQVVRTLKGNSASTVLVRQRGGTKDGIRQVLFGVRHFQAGEDAVLFLQPAPETNGTMQVVDLMQGNFRVMHDSTGTATVSNGVPGVSELTTGGQVRSYNGTRMSLQELETRVRKAVAK
jgi:hypothetical protein